MSFFIKSSFEGGSEYNHVESGELYRARQTAHNVFPHAEVVALSSPLLWRRSSSNSGFDRSFPTADSWFARKGSGFSEFNGE